MKLVDCEKCTGLFNCYNKKNQVDYESGSEYGMRGKTNNYEKIKTKCPYCKAESKYYFTEEWK